MSGTPIHELGLTKFDWQKLLAGAHKEFQAPKIPPSTRRLVLWTLLVYMRGPSKDKDGKLVWVDYDCFPSTRTIADAAGLSERAVCEHLAKADAEGWIDRFSRGLGDKGWKRLEYVPCIPSGTYPRSAPSTKVSEGTDPDAQGTDRHSQGTDPDDIKALTEGQSNISINKSVNKTENRAASAADLFFEGKTNELPNPNSGQTQSREGLARKNEPDLSAEPWRTAVSLLDRGGLSNAEARRRVLGAIREYGAEIVSEAIKRTPKEPAKFSRCFGDQLEALSVRGAA